MSFISLLLCFGVTADSSTQPSTEPSWQIIDIAAVDRFAIRLKVFKQASLADETWIGLEFANEGDKPVTVKNVSYRIESTRLELRTGTRRSSGGLASGSTFDLFPDAWKTTPVSTIVIPVHDVHRVFQQPSDYSSALLGMSPPDGLLVQAKLYLDMDLNKDQHFKTDPAGIPFTFEWLPPDAYGLDAMRTRLRKLLTKPEDRAHHAHIVATLLKVPTVGDSLSVDELLNGLNGRESNMSGRRYVASRIAERFPGDPHVVDYYLKRLQAKDRAATGDLVLVSGIWHPSFIEPLLAMCESEVVPGGYAMQVLSLHRQDWPKEMDIPSRLSARVLNKSRVLRKSPDQLAGNDLTVYWVNDARALSLSRDPGVIPLLRPFLDCKERVLGRDYSGGPDYRPAVRACDVALEAILTILGDDPRSAYAKAPAATRTTTAPHGFDQDEFEGTMNQVRDIMIADLKQRLDKR